MNGIISNAYAQTAGGAASGGIGQMQPILMMLLLVGVFYFMLIRPQQKKMKEQREMLSKLAEGDEVVTAGGILGKLTKVGDTLVTLEIADGVQIRVQRGQISQLVPKGTIKSA
jgi:preprotein translocase subunit YajC